MYENSFVLIGYSSFNGQNVDQNQAVDFGQMLRADAVVLYSSFSHTVTGSIPIYTPQVTTTTQSVSGTANTNGVIYGMGAPTNYNSSTSINGRIQSTSYSTETTYIPYSINRYNYGASYWVKKDDYIFGALHRELTPDERKLIGSNRGIALTIIVKNSVAFNENFFEGDILRSIGSEEIIDPTDFSNKISKLNGQTIDIKLLRDGKEMEKTITLKAKK
jgi:hypothetical protein